MLFPYDLNSTNQVSYYYAIELSRKINHNLKIVSTYEIPTANNSLYRRYDKDKNEEVKKKLHLRLLKLNGLYYENYNQWQLLRANNVKTLVKGCSIDQVLVTLIKNKSANLLLCDYSTFTKKLIPYDFLNKLADVNYTLWVMPQAIDEFTAKPKLQEKSSYVNKSDVFSDFLRQTKLYNLPNDIQHIHSEFRIPANV